MPKDFFRMVHALTFWKIVNEDQPRPRPRPRPSSKQDNSESEAGCWCCTLIITLIVASFVGSLIAKFFV